MPPFPKPIRHLSLLNLRQPPLLVSVSASRCRYESNAATSAAAAARDRKTLYYLLGIVGAMVGASYAAVPLYRRFCQATGYGGTVQRRETVEEKIARHNRDGTTISRQIVVQFNADVADGMPWKFTPTQKEVRVKPGESALAFYTAENFSEKPITGVSTYNVTPMKAAVYFNKIQCFCFEEQKLLPGEQIDMPVFFYIDPEFVTDPKMAGVNNIILSYTFFQGSCFLQQNTILFLRGAKTALILLPGEQIGMPVFFYIDPEFETDPKIAGVNNIILSYTLFKVNEY